MATGRNDGNKGRTTSWPRSRTYGLVGIALLATMTTACAGEDPETGEEIAETQAAFVVFDADAIDMGLRLKGYDADELRMPVEISAGDTVKLVSRFDDREVELDAGDVLVVRGADLRGMGLEGVEVRQLGADVAADAVRLVGSREALSPFAEDLEAALVAVDDDTWTLQLDDAWEALSGRAAPEGLIEVQPAPRDINERWNDQLPPKRTSLLTGEEIANAAMIGAPLRLMPSADEVSLSVLSQRPVSCADDVAGTWVSRSFYEGYGDWYVFTLTIDRDANDPSALVGSIDSRSWSGKSADEEPGACEELGTSTWGDEFDWTVRMDARGKVGARGKGFSFGGTAWQPKSTRCGQAPATGMYNLDQFAGRVVEGQWLQTLNNDGGRLADDPHVFRRISCR